MEKDTLRNDALVRIVMADDDADDRMLTLKAFKKNKLANEVIMLEDGQHLMDYLLGNGEFDAPPNPLPGLILLDLNMPRKDGREALKEIKKHPTLRKIPVVILTTSKADEDIVRSYDLGVNSFISKPVSFGELVSLIQEIGSYWFGLVKLP